MENRLQLWSPVWGWLATKKGKLGIAKGQDLVLYETAIQEALEQGKIVLQKKVGTIQSDGLLRCG